MRTGLLLGIFLLCAMHAALAADPAVRKGEALLAKVEAQTAGIKDFVADLKARVNLPLLPGVGLSGHVYFKQPRKVRVQLDNLPRFVQGYKQQFSGLAPTRRNKTDYTARHIGQESVLGRPAEVVAVTAKDPKSNLRLITMWIDPKDFTVPRAALKYADQTVITTQTKYMRIEGFLLPASQDMQFNLPHIAGTATAAYSNYKINQGLADAVFDKPQKGR